jgi:release factor glutamine methyltransferase
MRARDALREGAAALAGTETPFLDASLLLADALGTDTTKLLASGPDEVAEPALERYRASLASRTAGLPVAYILGYKEFWGRRFAVDRRVLVPRPDTETLVAAALRMGDAIARETAARGPSPRVLDLCTGSGCVAISIAADRPLWAVSASDISDDALAVARANADAVLGRGAGAGARPGGPLELRRGDLMAAFDGALSFDMIVSNPPYVPAAEARSLLERGWSEPLMALDGGEDGLETMRRLAPEAARRLAPGGALLVEADGEQAQGVAELLRAAGFMDVDTLRDLGGRPRVTCGRMPWTT